MEGFEGILKQRILGAVPHLTISAKQPLSLADVESDLSKQPWSEQVQQVFPLVQSQAIVQMPGDLKGVLAQGIHQNAIPAGITNNLVDGNWQDLLAKKYGLVMRPIHGDGIWFEYR